MSLSGVICVSFKHCIYFILLGLNYSGLIKWLYFSTVIILVTDLVF